MSFLSFYECIHVQLTCSVHFTILWNLLIALCNVSTQLEAVREHKLRRGSAALTAVWTKAADLAEFLQLPLPGSDKKSVESSWLQSWFGSSPKSNGLLLVRRPTPPKKFIRIHVTKFLSYQQVSYSCPRPTMVNIPGSTWPRSTPKSNHVLLVSHPTLPKIHPNVSTAFWIILLADEHTKTKTWRFGGGRNN